NIVDDLLVRAAATQQGAKVVALSCEKAGIELAVGRETSPRAVLAKRLRHRRDDPDFTPFSIIRIQVAPPLGNLARIVRADRFKRKFASDDADDFSRGHDVVQAPAVGVADVHVFDEAKDGSAILELK